MISGHVQCDTVLWFWSPVPWLSSVFISGRLTPVLWLCDSDYVTLCLRVCFISGPIIPDACPVTLCLRVYFISGRMIPDLLLLWLLTPVPWLSSAFISGCLTPVLWLRLCDSMPPSLFYFWSHNSGLVTALTIDSGSMTLFCFHFWSLDSGTMTPVLWLCDSGYVTL